MKITPNLSAPYFIIYKKFHLPHRTLRVSINNKHETYNSTWHIVGP